MLFSSGRNSATLNTDIDAMGLPPDCSSPPSLFVQRKTSNFFRITKSNRCDAKQEQCWLPASESGQSLTAATYQLKSNYEFHTHINPPGIRFEPGIDPIIYRTHGRLHHCPNHPGKHISRSLQPQLSSHHCRHLINAADKLFATSGA